MRIGTIYQNLWAGYETYFVYLGKNSRIGRAPTATNVLQITKLGRTWQMSMAQYSLASLTEDEEHYPRVGYIDMEELLTKGILKGIE